MSQLSRGAIQAICNGEKIENPVFEVTGIKPFTAPDSKSKLRLSVYDGEKSTSFVMLPMKYNELIERGDLTNGKRIKVLKYCTKKQNEKTIILLTEIQVLNESDVMDTESSHQQSGPSIVALTNQPLVQTHLKQVASIPIVLLNSYQNAWTIIGRCTSKQTIRTWNKPSGEGKLFNFAISDSTGDIRITCFNREVDKFYELLEINKVYSVSKGQIKPANRQFNKTKSDFEITLNTESVVKEIVDGDSIPQISYKFTTIEHISEQQVGCSLDVVGVAHNIADVATIMSQKFNKELRKRDVVLVDQSGFSVPLTLWNDQIECVEGLETPTLVLRGAGVREFHGKQLSSSADTVILVNSSTVPEAVALAGWYRESGHSTLFTPIGGGSGGSFENSQGQQAVSLLSQMVCSSANNDKADFFTVYAAVNVVKSANFVYKACSTDGCNKKIEELGDGLYRCSKCDKSLEDYKYRLLVNIKLTDISDSKWVTCFQDVAEVILGKTAAEMGQLAECKETEELDKIFKEALFKLMYFKLKAKMETYNDETRLKVIAVSGTMKNDQEDIDEILQLLN